MKNQELVSFALAVQFLTRLPVDVGDRFTPELFARSVRFYPLVGALVGAVGAAIYLVSALVFSHAVAVVCAMVALLALTGAFHEDGLADTFDGLGGGHDRAAKLQIMRDSRLGTYGTAALVSALALRAALLVSLSPEMLPWALVLGQSLSRLSSVLAIRGSAYVRDEGTGKPVAETVDTSALLWVITFGAVFLLAALGAVGGATLCAALLGLAVAHIVLRRWIERHLGGYTGDTLGAIQQVSDIGFLMGWAAWP